MLIGQAPNKTGDPGVPLEGRAGKKIAELFRISFEEYLVRTHRTNIFPRFQGKVGKGDRFPVDKAKKLVERLIVPKDVALVLLVGKNVASAFGIRDADYFDRRFLWSSGNDARVIEARIVPHPSGINRWWNDDKNRRTASRRFKSIASSVWNRRLV